MRLSPLFCIMVGRVNVGYKLYWRLEFITLAGEFAVYISRFLEKKIFLVN